MPKIIIRQIVAFIMAFAMVMSGVTATVTPSIAYATSPETTGANSFATTLVDRTTKSDKITFDIWAKDASGQKVATSKINVTNNGQAVAVNWDDSEKTSYTVKLTTGINKINITVNSDTTISKDYTIINLEAEVGENIGDYVFSLDAFTLGLGYIIEPTRMPIYKGDNAAKILVNQLDQKGFTLEKTGSIESGFYLASITKKEGSIFDAGVKIPSEIDALGYGIDPTDHRTSLGEFDFNSMSGWMYKLNNVFPNVGFADSYLQENDVMSVQFTVGYGAELGGGWSGNVFPTVNRDEITKQLAYINSAGQWKAKFLANSRVAAAYENHMKIAATFGITQNIINDAENEMNAAIGEVIDPLINQLPQTIDETNWKSIAETVEALNNTTLKEQQSFTNIAKYNALKEQYDDYSTVEQLVQDIEKLPTVNELTVEKDLLNVLKLQNTYQGLEPKYQGLISNIAHYNQVINKMNELVSNSIAQIEANIAALPDVANLALADESKIIAINENIAKLDEKSQQKISNLVVLEAAKAQLIVLKDLEKVANVMRLIGDIPLTEKIILTDKTQIKEARAAYTALSSTLKKTVTNLAVLTAAETKITWFEAIVTSNNNIAALPTVEVVNFSNETKIKAARTAYNKLDAEQKKAITDLDKLVNLEAKLIEYAPIKAVETLIVALPSAYSTKLTNKTKIEEARMAFNQLSVEWQAKIQATYSKKLVDVEAKLKSLLEAEEVNALNQLISSIPTLENITYANRTSITSMMNQYNSFSEANKLKVVNYETVLATDQLLQAIEEAEGLISRLPTADKVELYHESEIKQALAAFNKVLPVQVTDASKTKLATVNEALAKKLSQAQITEVTSLIKSLPKLVDLTINDEKRLLNTIEQFNALSDAQKALVSNKTELDLLQAAMTNLKMFDSNSKINYVNNLISVLPDIQNIDTTDELKLEKITEAYNELTSIQQQNIVGYTIVTQMQIKIDDLKKTAIKTVEAIAKLPEPELVQGTDRIVIEKVRAEYTLLTAGQKALVQNSDRLNKIENALAQEESNAVLSMVIGIIILPEVDKVNLTHHRDILALRSKYEKMSAKQKELITNYSKLLLIEEKIVELQSENSKIAKGVEMKISALPKTISIKNKQEIEDVRKAYEKLAIEQQSIIMNYEELLQAENALAPFVENEQKAASKVSAYITALPTVKKLVVSDEAAIKTVRKAYNALTTSERKLVKNVSTLVEAENKMKELQRIALITTKNAKLTVSTMKNTSSTLTGSASKSTKIYVYKGNKLLKATTVNSKGKYTLAIGKQKKGTKLKIVQKNSVGKTVKTQTISIKAAKVNAPRSVKASTKKITGIATGAKKIAIYNGSKKVATASLKKNGAFSSSIKQLKKGTKLSVIAYDSANNKSTKTTVTIK